MSWFIHELKETKKYLLEGATQLAHNFRWQPSELYRMDLNEMEMWMDESIKLKRKIDRATFLNKGKK